jgi:hypothetical protein
MKKIGKRKGGWGEENVDYLLTFVKETPDDHEKTDLEKELNKI